jgi:hypothetical protein
MGAILPEGVTQCLVDSLQARGSLSDRDEA